jgi:hypothetical protein
MSEVKHTPGAEPLLFAELLDDLANINHWDEFARFSKKLRAKVEELRQQGAESVIEKMPCGHPRACQNESQERGLYCEWCDSLKAQPAGVVEALRNCVLAMDMELGDTDLPQDDRPLLIAMRAGSSALNLNRPTPAIEGGK